jgi:hypothetical protein
MEWIEICKLDEQFVAEFKQLLQEKRPFEILKRNPTGKVTTCEDVVGKISIVVVDETIVYTVLESMLNIRLGILDMPLGEDPLGVYAPYSVIRMPETYLHKNVIQDQVVYYSFGNLFGHKSLLLGERFMKFKQTDVFQTLVGRKLRSVKFHLDENNQYALVHYKFRD